MTSQPYLRANITGKVYPDIATEIVYQTDGLSLIEANISYTGNGWDTVDTVPMDVSNRTCNATIPGQKAGTQVDYRIGATDILNNYLTVTGNYSVKAQPTLNFTLAEDTIYAGQNVTVAGKIAPNDKNSKVTLQVFSANSTETWDCTVNSDGTFIGSFLVEAAGEYAVSASGPETKTAWRCDSSQLLLTVNEPPLYMKYSIYIAIGLVGALVAGGVVYYLKSRNR